MALQVPSPSDFLPQPPISHSSYHHLADYHDALSARGWDLASLDESEQCFFVGESSGIVGGMNMFEAPLASVVSVPLQDLQKRTLLHSNGSQGSYSSEDNFASFHGLG